MEQTVFLLAWWISDRVSRSGALHGIREALCKRITWFNLRNTFLVFFLVLLPLSWTEIHADRGTKRLHSGFVTSFPADFPVVKPIVLSNLTADERAWIEKHPIVEIGVDGNWPPIDFVDDSNRHSGIAADYLNVIANRTGLRFKVHPGPTFKQMLDRVRSGQLKVGTPIVDVGDRSRDLYFSKPFVDVRRVITVRRDQASFDSMQSLRGKTVAIEKGFSTSRQIKSSYPEIHLLVVDSTVAALRAVSWEKADAYVGNQLVVDWVIQQQQLNNLKISGDSGFAGSSQRFAVYKENSWKPLIGILNKALTSIDSEDRRIILQRWTTPPDPTAAITVKLSPDQREWLSQHPEIRMGVDAAWPPIEFVDKNGLYQGISSEYIKLVARTLNIRMDRVPGITWEEVMAKAKQGDIDLLTAIARTDEREGYLNFTSPYIRHPMVIFTRQQADFITGIKDLTGKRVAVEKSYVTLELLSRDYPKMELLLVEDTRQALRLVSTGKADAYIGEIAVGSYLIRQNGLTNIKVAGPAPYTYDLCIAVRKDWPEMIPILETALDAIPEKERIAIRKRWLSIRYDIGVDYSVVWQVIGLASILLVLAITWMVLMGRQKAKLLASEERFRDAMSAVSESVWDWNVKTGIRHFTPSLFLELGYTHEQVPETQEEWMALIHPEDKAKRAAALVDLEKNVATRNQILTLDYRIRRADRCYAHILAGGRVTERDRRGDVVKRAGTIRDITAQKEAEEQFRTLVDTLPIAIIVADLHGTIILDNSQAVREIGIQESLIGHNTAEFYADSAERDRIILLLKEKGTIHQEQVRYKVHSGDIVDCLLSVLPIKFAGQTAMLGVMVNLTERIEMERVLAEAKESAEQANQIKSTFLANMSHEIRTPMNAIIGLGYLVLKTDLKPLQRSYLEKMQGSAQALLGIINDILDFSKIEAGKLDIERAEFSLSEVLENLSSLVSLKAEDKGMDVLFSVSSEVPGRLIGDSLRLGQVLINLITNAVKFTEYGEVLLRIEVLERAHHRTTLNFSVNDTGIGIPEDRIETLFLPFTQADESHTRRFGGTGLGLAVCHFLVDAMSGSTIQVESRPGQGSTFSFDLPFELPTDADRFCISRNTFGNLRVLVVDDNAKVRNVLAEMFELIGIRINTLKSGEELISYLESVNDVDRAHFDLLLIDMSMPGLKGLEVAAKIREKTGFAALPILLMGTTYGWESVQNCGDDTGQVGFLSKPINPFLLYQCINRAIRGGGDGLDSRQNHKIRTSHLEGNVLLVEDNQINQLVASEILRGFGLGVEVADDGQVALECLATQPFDLVLMDIQMPRMDGFETTRQIRTNPLWRSLPVIAMTAHAMIEEKEKCVAAGMNDHVAKPIDPEYLFSTLSQWLPESNDPDPVVEIRRAKTIRVVESLPGIDVASSLKRLAGNRALFRKLLHDFIKDYRDSPEKLKYDVKHRDFASAERLVHTMTGIAGHIGASELQHAAQSLVLVFSSGLQPGSGQIQAYCQAIREVCDGITDWLQKNRTEVDGKKAIHAINLSQEFVDRLEVCLIKASPEANTLLGKLDLGSLSGEVLESVLKMIHYVERYDFESARELLRSLAIHLSE